jgi:fructosamine-3-kinase
MTDITPNHLIEKAARKLGKPEKITHLYGGDWASVFKVSLIDGTRLAAKVPRAGHEHLAMAEGKMLQYLNQKAPGLFPEIAVLAKGVLLLDFIENDGAKGAGGERQAGRHLAQLHNITEKKFGFFEDTIFGPSPQPNTWADNWVNFFRDRRLLYMSEIAHKAGRIEAGLVTRIEKFCGHLEDYLPEKPTPVLLHGDFWGGNVLFYKGRCAAFVDPAIYYGHSEADLAFATLFSSFGKDFFEGYCESRRIEDGFFDDRLDIYNLWPLLFHAYWFGGHYVGSVDATLKRLGF